ncbi:MAG: UbiX family flavin prenyltransferase [Desulfobacteraceae bacterium]|nr:UbiX family flavin prenyltransferase [Desulfobacteraceae bacterium]
MTKRLIVAMSGASGAYAAELLIEKSPWPVMLIASKWAKQVYEHECGLFENLVKKARQVLDNEDMTAAPASGSVPVAGMVIMPCSTHTLASISAGLADTLITRAAHCQLKEKRPLILGVRETPWTAVDLENAARLAGMGVNIMPLSPPFFMFKGRSPCDVTLKEVMSAYVDRVLALLGHTGAETWEDIR